ncbi:MAG: 30S ribosomal protein S9 [Candidatus Kerfeldbacteria bacterium]|nr:30S ribosomal protein S9 [Candidatus Kerfeldbacteria bacterium]
MPTTKKTPKKATKKKPVSTRRAVAATKEAPVPPTTRPTYIFAVGRRKQAVARVRLHPTGSGEITINNRPLVEYFPTFVLQKTVRDPLVTSHRNEQGSVTVKVAGGGSHGQADAVRLGITRALVADDADLRLPLKRAGFLRRDPRVKERKKYGLKRARRAPQWQKR